MRFSRSTPLRRALVLAVAGSALAGITVSSMNASAAPGADESTFVPVVPARVLDTRDPSNVGLAGPFVSAVSQDLQVTGTIETTTGRTLVVPAGATGVTLNVTVVSPSANGFLSIRPANASGPPTTSNLNFLAGQIVPNSVSVQVPTLGPDAGKIEITFDAYGQSGPTTDVLVDVTGYTTRAGLVDLQQQITNLQTQVASLGSGGGGGGGGTTIVDNSITTSMLVDGSVTHDKLATNSVDGTNIIDGSVNTADLADGAVTNPKLANNAVTSNKILDGTIAAADLADASVTSAKLLDGTVATADLADGSVTTAKIVDGSVATADLANNAVTTAKIADSSVTAAKLAPGAITNVQIGDDAVGAGELNAVFATGLVDRPAEVYFDHCGPYFDVNAPGAVAGATTIVYSSQGLGNFNNGPFIVEGAATTSNNTARIRVCADFTLGSQGGSVDAPAMRFQALVLNP